MDEEEQTQKYFPLKCVVACSLALMAYFGAELSKYQPIKNILPTYETRTKYPLRGHRDIGEFIVDIVERDEELEIPDDFNSIENI